MKKNGFYLIPVLFYLIFSLPLGVMAKTKLDYRILFGGDFCMYPYHHSVYKNEDITPDSFKYKKNPFKNFEKILKQSDLRIINLETVLTDIKDSPLADLKDSFIRSESKPVISVLKKYSFNPVALANNHSMDYGINGLKEMLDLLRQNNITFIGAGLTEEQASKPFITELKSGNKTLKIAVLNAFEYKSHFETKYAYYAKGSQGGVNELDTDKISLQIKDLKKNDPEIFVVVYPHWGYSATIWATDYQKELARKLSDAGADLIIGHHVHKMEEIDYYKGKWIIYSLGNFIFKLNDNYEKTKADPFSSVCLLEFAQKNGEIIKTIKIYPIYTANDQTGFQPGFLNKNDFNKLFEDLKNKTAGETNFFQQKVDKKKDKFGYHLEIEL